MISVCNMLRKRCHVMDFSVYPKVDHIILSGSSVVFKIKEQACGWLYFWYVCINTLRTAGSAKGA